MDRLETRLIFRKHCGNHVNVVLHTVVNGVDALRVVGLLAEWCGCGERRTMTAEEFADVFRIESLPTEDVVFRGVDHQWLMAK